MANHYQYDDQVDINIDNDDSKKFLYTYLWFVFLAKRNE